MNRRPRLIVSLPGRSARECRGQVERARAAGADIAEIRVDRWADRSASELSQLLPSPLPLLATYRSRAEGGEGEDDPARRAPVLAAIRGAGFPLIDIESGRDIAPEGRDPGPSFVASDHRTSAVSSAWLERVLRDPAPPGGLRKAVAPATVQQFLDDWLPVLEAGLPPDRAPMSVGPSGPLARVWAPRFGAAAVFAKLPESDTAGPPVEPSQLPVDQLRRFVDANDGRAFCVLGSPIAHSLSPSVHSVWLADERRPAVYAAVEARTEAELAGLLSLGKRGWWSGWNVTHPWKGWAAAVADTRTEAVLRTGAANTLTFQDGRVHAALTDVDAVRRRVAELRTAGPWSGTEALVVGTGGAARASILALRLEGSHVFVTGRHAGAVRAVGDALGADPAEDRAPEELDLVVHATPVGRAGAGPLVPSIEPWLGPSTTLLDFVYGAEDPSVRDLAERRGATYEDGRRLLVYQAAASHALWWGEPPAAESVATALRRIGCAG